MIEFSGEVSKELLPKMYKTEAPLYSVTMLLAFTIVSAIIAWCASWIIIIEYAIIIYCVAVFFFVLGLVAAFGKNVRDNVDSALPSCVRILKEEKEIEILREISPACRTFEDVIKVIDYGEYYSFRFSFFSRKTVCVCEKSKLVQGTLEEFEELFSDVLIRKPR